MASILLVEDDPLVRSVLKHALQEAGYKVEEASNGNEALKSCRQHLPALVITDIVMPEKEGLATIMELRRDYPQIKIIAMSGSGQDKAEGYLKVAAKFGAQRLLSKPFAIAEFVDAARQALESD